jgi:YVTN family beta-propeller protein
LTDRFSRAARVTCTAAALACSAGYLGCSGTDIVVPLAPPTISAISPAVGVQGTTAAVSVAGENFVADGSVVVADGTGISATGIAVKNAEALSANLIIASDATLGLHTVKVKTAAGMSASLPFTVNPPTPQLTTLSAPKGVTGLTVHETLTGANFVAGGVVIVTGGGITISNIALVSSTSVTVDFGIAADATLGERNVTVSTVGGTSGAKSFTVLPPIPTITSLSATTGVIGTAVSDTLTGTNFVAGATVNLSGTGVMVSNVSVLSATSIAATFTIASDATLGGRDVTVTTSGGTSGLNTFTVLPPGPTITSLSATAGVTGTTVSDTLTGTNFVTGATVNLSGTGVTVSNVSVLTATSIAATFTIASDATLGGRDVTVTTSGGTSGLNTFTVLPPEPTITSLSATTGVTGTTVHETLTGASFVAGGVVIVTGGGVTISNIALVSSTSVTVDLVIADDAALGDRTVTISTVGGTSGPKTFTVLPPVPTVTSLSATTGVTGTTVTETLTGTSFVTGATVDVSGTGVTVSNVSVASATSISATLTIASDATLGGHDVTVTTVGGTSAAQTFTVNPPPPTLTAITPASAAKGAIRTVTLSGTNFISGATSVAVSGTGVTATNVSVASATSMTVDLVAASNATSGAHSVTVMTAGGTSAAQTYTIVNPPQIASFTSSGTFLVVANRAILSWAVASASSCSIDQGIGIVACADTLTVTPGSSKTYTLTATANGLTVTSSVQISVGAPSRFLYAANGGTDNSVSSYSIDNSTGAPTLVGTTAAGTQPYGIAVDPAGRFAYVANNGANSVSSYTIGSNGGLTANGGTVTVGSKPRQVTIDLSGRFLYVVNQTTSTGSISTFAIGSDGRLSFLAPTTVGNQPTDFAVDPLGRFAYAINSGGGSISTFRINSDGTLQSTGTSTTGGAPANAVVDPTGKYLYVTSQSANRVLMFTISPNTGILSSIAGTATTGTAPNGIAVDPTGQYAYVANSGSASVSFYTITSGSGLLVLKGSIAAGTVPRAIGIEQSGKYVYVVNEGSNTVTYYPILSGGGLGASTSIGTGTGPRGIAVSR